MKILTPLLFSVLLASCGDSKNGGYEGPEAIIKLELVDSLVVDELNVLTMDDRSENGYYLLKSSKTRIVYLVDEKGLIIKEYDILNEGPNGAGNGAFGYRFLDNDKWVVQGFYNGYHMYNLEGEKLLQVPNNNVGLFAITVYTFRTTFNPYMKNGVPYIIGEEPNSFNPAEIDAKKLGTGFYQQARTVYNYNLDTEESELLPTYPEEWEPRQNNRYVGPSYPFVAYDRKKQELSLLPVMGSQLFVYDYADSLPILKHTVELTHRFRPKDTPLAEEDEYLHFSDYPKFTDLRILGDYVLVGFHTQIPVEIMRQLRAESEQYYSLPEYKAAQEQYSKPYYLLVKEGEQIGILDSFPVNGTLNFTDEEGILYINDNLSPEIERDYNVFYKLRIRE